MSLIEHLKIWQQYGGYLMGIKSIAAKFSDLSARQIINAMKDQNYMGGWSDAVITNAINSARCSHNAV